MPTLSYSSIHLKIIKFRQLNDNKHFLPHDIFNVLKTNRILKVRIRGKRGGAIRLRNFDLNNRVNLDNLVPITCNRLPITNYTNIAVVNTRSIRNKTLEFIENIIDNDIQICIVTETWLSDGDDALITECTPQNFSMLPVNRCNRAGGGTALLCNSKMKPRLIRSLTENYFEISEYLIRYQLTSILIFYSLPSSIFTG